MSKVVIGTRESKLALWQAKYAHKLLSDSNNDRNTTFEICGMTTKGDKDQNTSLSKFSDKGIFTKELDVALLNNTIDCAVHCVKDLPTKFHKDLGIACYLKRGKRNDCLLIDKIRYPQIKSLNDLPKHDKFIIGTGSLRRQSLLKALNLTNNINVCGIRGNLNTRLNKLVNKNLYDAIILAEIGVQRLGWMNHENDIKNDDHIDQNALKINIKPLNMNDFPYAIGQGALAIMCRQNDIDNKTKIYEFINRLNDFCTEICCLMERNLLRILEGGCKVPIACRSDVMMQCKFCNLWNSISRQKCQACFNNISDKMGNVEVKLYLYGLVLSQNGKIKYESKEIKSINMFNYDVNKLNIRDHKQYQVIADLANQIGEIVANKLKSQGAQKVIDQIKQEAIKSIKSIKPNKTDNK